MFSKFKLNDIAYSDFEKYESEGKEYYEKTKTDIQNSQKEFIGKDGVVDGSGLQESWFSTKQKFDVFLSHSHTDEKLAISLAGFLKRELNLNTFIDSCLWGYSNDLLREIDEKYCRHSNGTSFDYDKRNYSTSHVHMMLSIALSRMIDKCESVFFLNSENSISIAEEISKERTASPWIYNELSLADMIEIRPINCYRDKFLQFSHRAYDAVNESSSLQIKYEVGKMLRSFISLSKYDLISCAKEWRANKKSFQSALDYIYLSKDIIIKQDVLIS